MKYFNFVVMSDQEKEMINCDRGCLQTGLCEPYLIDFIFILK